MTTREVAGFVLAGGASTRMGADKALLEIAGEPILVRVVRLVESGVAPVAVIGDPRRYAHLGYAAVADDEPGQGPLGGISTALRASSCDWNLIVGCDLPYLTQEWLAELVRRAHASNADVVMPLSPDAVGKLHPEPLCAMYHRRCGAAIRVELARGVRKVTDGLAGLNIEYIPPAEWKPFDSAGRLFKNMNSPADYEEARQRLEQGKS